MLWRTKNISFNFRGSDSWPFFPIMWQSCTCSRSFNQQLKHSFTYSPGLVWCMIQWSMRWFFLNNASSPVDTERARRMCTSLSLATQWKTCYMLCFHGWLIDSAVEYPELLKWHTGISDFLSWDIHCCFKIDSMVKTRFQPSFLG